MKRIHQVLSATNENSFDLSSGGGGGGGVTDESQAQRCCCWDTRKQRLIKEDFCTYSVVNRLINMF